MKRFALTLGCVLCMGMPVYAGQWIKADTGWTYLQDDGQPIKEGWFTDVDGKVYNFNGGITRSGKYTENGKSYYFNPTSGERMSGIVEDGGKHYFYGRSGVIQTGWISVNGNWYYTNPDGSFVTGLKELSGNKYWFKEAGEMAKNEWVNEDTYFATSTGQIATSQWVDEDTYVNAAGKVSDRDNTKDKSTSKQRVDNKVYTVEEYLAFVEDYLYRYSDETDTLMEDLVRWREDYNEEHVYNYTSTNEDEDESDYIAKNELPEFEVDSKLCKAAALRAVELASQQRASGARPNGKDWQTVLDDTGYGSYNKVVESVAFGQDTGEDAFVDLQDDGSHQNHWKDKKLIKIGAGAACDVDGKMYWVVFYMEED